MSKPFGGFGAGGVTVFQESQENHPNQGLRKTKRDDMLSKQPANKRPALGVITNTTRVQPFRTAKQGGGFDDIQEPTKCSSKPFGGFNIHVDEDVVFKGSDAVQEVDTGLPKPDLQLHASNRQPLSVLSNVIKVEDSPERGSPMVLDTSVDLAQEENPDDRFDQLLCCSEYAEDIYTYLLELERKHRPRPHYMSKQPDITSSMRSILVDWLVEVAEEYKLHRETLCLSVNYIDRFLSQMSVLRGKLQLVGAASVFLASKYEEIYPPDISEFVYITDDSYTQQQILRMEHLILKVLSFNIAMPTFNLFCEKFLRDANSDDRTKSLAMYLCELTMVDGDTFMKYLPSEIAATALCLANTTLSNVPWPQSVAQSTRYSLVELEPCLRDMYTAFCRAPTHPQQAIREKYKHSKYHQVSLLSPPSSIPLLNSSNCQTQQ